MRVIVLICHRLCGGALVPTHSYLASFFNGRELLRTQEGFEDDYQFQKGPKIF